MLCEFIDARREDIVARTRERARSRSWTSVSSWSIDNGVRSFLIQVSEVLRLEATSDRCQVDTIESSARRHGAESLAAGFSVGQVVHDYGDICQIVTEAAAEEGVPVTIREFHTLNHCLDVAIAEAVSEHARLTTRRWSEEEAERVGVTAHELRDLLNGAILAFHALRRASPSVVDNRIGTVLQRNLTGLQSLVDRTLSYVRLAAGKQRHERLVVTAFMNDIATGAALHAECRGITFTLTPVDDALAVDGDPQLLGSAVTNLLHNAFKNTPSGGAVILRAHAEGSRVVVEIEDECGGIPEGKRDLFRCFGDRRGLDQSGLGLGLSIARQAVRAHDGEIHVRNMPGRGCIFAIDLPLASQ